MKFRFVLSLILFFALFSACQARAPITQVEREDLFTLQIGRLEDQLALFDLDGDRGLRRANIAMRNGLFYISDSNGGKILRYTSYGDLLFMIYNQDINPPPLTLRPLSDTHLVTRWAVPHPLREPGKITVDSRQHIFVRDALPYDRHSFDPESRALLNNVILHFDADGRFVNYIGREGIGGSPFPRIVGLFTSAGDELAVVCRVLAGWEIYWFSPEGILLFVVKLKANALPIPPDWEDVIPSLDKIAVCPDARIIYVKVDYFRNIYDESTNIRTGIEPDGSVIWTMNAETGIWLSYVDVPFFEYSFTEQNRRVSIRVFYSLMGVISGGRAFLSFPVDGGYSILIMHTEPGYGQQHQGFIRLDNCEMQFNVFDLSAEGILSGLLVNEWEVRLAWWRTDKLLRDGS